MKEQSQFPKIKRAQKVLMKRIISLLLLVLIYVPTGDARTVININDHWKFYKGECREGYRPKLDDSGWEKIRLPHTWNVTDSFDDRNADDGLDISYYYYRGYGWYRKNLDISFESGQNVYIEFEAANKVTDVWINGQYAGEHIGGYSGFRFNITPFIESGRRTLIAVRVNNAYHYDIPPHRADYTMYGGIYRDVRMIITDAACIERVLISTPRVTADAASLKLNTALKNNSVKGFKGTLELTLKKPQGDVCSRWKQNVSIAPDSVTRVIIEDVIFEPDLWSPDNPTRYSIEVRLLRNGKEIDAISEKFGCRWFSFDADNGFYLNGRHLRLKGVNRHQDKAGFGNALSNEHHVRDIEIIKSMGANFLRLAHYPQDPAVLDACDSLGVLVWEEIPVITSVGKMKFRQNAKNMLREMIMQHYNHPAIIIWGLMNETMRHQPDDQLHWTVTLCKELNQLAKQLDPSRMTAQAQFDSRGTDILDVTDIRGWNRYFGWYKGKFEDFAAFMDDQKRRNPHHVIIISEYGAGSKRGYHVENPTAPDFSENWQLKFHQSHWKMISDRPWIAGSCVWNMFDFASDEKGGNIPHINQKGLADFDRIPKDVFYFYQSQWNDEPMIYIVSHTWRERSGPAGELTEIEVLSNCDRVELLLNNRSMGAKVSPFLWQTALNPGVNKVHAIGRSGSISLEDSITVNYRVTTE